MNAENVDHEALAAMGLRLEEVEVKHTECWPENWISFRVFAALETQWNWVTKVIPGPSGSPVFVSERTGLNYASAPVVLQMGGVAKKEHAQILHDLRVMEREALTIFNKKS